MIVRPAATPPAARLSRRGFTLVELLAVMAIIMVLAGLGAFAVVSQMDKAKRNEAFIQMSKIEQAAKQYYIANSTWPASVMDLVQQQPDGSGAPLEGGLAAVTDPWKGQYSGGPQLDAAGVERYVVTCTTTKGEQLTWPKQ